MSIPVPGPLTTLALLTLLASIFCLTALQGEPSQFEKLRIDAEKRYAEGSYAQAFELYRKAADLELSPADARWVDFRLADTLWRAEAASRSADDTKLEQARQDLEVLIRDINREEDRDLVWAEVNESLGDYWWARRDSWNWGMGLQYYQQALDWWAGARDVELARTRYLAMVRRMAEPKGVDADYYYGYYGNYIPIELVENAQKIARSDRDRAYFAYLFALTLKESGASWEQRLRIPEAFEQALKAGRASDWYDDSLYHYADYLQHYGRVTPLDNGSWRTDYDHAKALELYRRLVTEYKKGESRFYDDAKDRIEEITGQSLGVGVSYFFLPGSEIEYHLSWRNLKQIELSLYRFDLTRHVQFNKDAGSGAWVQQVSTSGLEKVRTWTKDTADKGDYQPKSESLRLDGKLPAGAYLIEAKAGKNIARDVILVTDATVVLKNSGRQALAFVADALTGAPIPKASITLWERAYHKGEWGWRRSAKEAGEDGLAHFTLDPSDSSVELFAAAALKDRQAFALTYAYGGRGTDDSWKVYAYTDRPAYRPGDEVQWKFLARKRGGEGYATPANELLEYEIYDGRGSKVADGKATLNAFGSAWGSLKLTESMPLGEFRVNFWTAGRARSIGSATLFRLEEYKLPEFKVSIQTPEENGKKKAFRLGETVEASIQADYYFGGPVANATVEVLVYQNPFYHGWQPPRDYPWLYTAVSRPSYYGGQGPIIKRETIKTDATGRAVVSFETPRGGQDFEYRIEARVTDASRREVVGSDSVRVTRQRFYVYANPDHYLHRPQDKVQVDFKALDANENPVQTEGTVKVTRDFWYEIWIDPRGKEVKGDELKALQRGRVAFPPAPAPDGVPWKLKFRGYQHDEILTRTVKTNAEGELEFTFTPDREGYYRVSWVTPEKGRAPITTETAVWVATLESTDLGYYQGGLELILDKDTFRPGRKAPVMVVAPASERYVLFSIEGQDLMGYQLLHLTGSVKLVEVDLTQKHVPNIFLSAAMVADRQMFINTKEVVVPPVQHYLEVDVKADREQYQPREEATLTVTAKDHEGRPVQAEVGLSLVDESIFYIQQDYAGDPRQYYFGEKRGQQVQTSSMFQQRGLVKLEPPATPTARNEVGRDVPGDLADDESGAVAEESSLDVSYGAGMAAAPMKSASMRRAVLGAASAAPAPAAEAPMRQEKAKKADKEMAAPVEVAPGEPPAEDAAVVVRSDFRATALWQPDLVTGKDGKATVKVKMPDTLTGWKATARAATSGNQFGIAHGATRTRQPLIVRLQAPRFFLTGDTVTVSAIINNNTGKPLQVGPNLEAAGLEVTGWLDGGKAVKGKHRVIEVPPDGEARADWIVAVKSPGEAMLKVTGRGGEYADAMEKRFPVFERGLEKLVARAGKMRGDEVTVKLEIPKARKPETTVLTVQVAPSLATTMVDALPYLIDYPYGCTEQTMSRFLPAVITRKTLKDLGLSAAQVEARMFGGIEPEAVGKTQPGGRKDLRKLDDMVKQGLERLYDFQHDDGGWGWWKPGDSDPFMSAYVVWGLTLAREAGVKLKDGVLERGARYLQEHLIEAEKSYDLQAFMLHALGAWHKVNKASGIEAFEQTALANLWDNRDRLNAYTRALFAIAAHQLGDGEKARVLVRNLENGVKLDTAPDTSILEKGLPSTDASVMGTAHWGEDGIYWRWSDGGIEATAFALRALLTIDPKHKLVEPVMNWLVKNRRGASWSNTRDTAMVVLAFNDYLKVSGELGTDLEYELSVNGHAVATKRVTPKDVLSAPGRFVVDRKHIRDGANDIRLKRKQGKGALYFAAYAEFFSLEEPITPAGNEIFVRRDYLKLVPRATLLKGTVYDRVALKDGERVKSGERVEVIVTIEAKNDYEYLVFEDLKPAGLEAVEVRSGETLYARELKSGAVDRKFGGGEGAEGTEGAEGAEGTEGVKKPRGAAARRAARILPPPPSSGDSSDYTGRDRWVYQELRDRKVALFVDKLPQGVWEIRYDLRAEVPGRFSALPVVGHAMYIPEIRGNSAEIRLEVLDR